MNNLQLLRYPLPFKGRVGVGMGLDTIDLTLSVDPIPHLGPLAALSPLKGEEREKVWHAGLMSEECPRRLT